MFTEPLLERVNIRVHTNKIFCRLKRDLSAILDNLEVSESDPKKNTVLVLIMSLITASLRSLKVLVKPG